MDSTSNNNIVLSASNSELRSSSEKLLPPTIISHEGKVNKKCKVPVGFILGTTGTAFIGAGIGAGIGYGVTVLTGGLGVAAIPIGAGIGAAIGLSIPFGVKFAVKICKHINAFMNKRKADKQKEILVQSQILIHYLSDNKSLTRTNKFFDNTKIISLYNERDFLTTRLKNQSTALKESPAISSDMINALSDKDGFQLDDISNDGKKKISDQQDDYSITAAAVLKDLLIKMEIYKKTNKNINKSEFELLDIDDFLNGLQSKLNSHERDVLNEFIKLTRIIWNGYEGKIKGGLLQNLSNALSMILFGEGFTPDQYEISKSLIQRQNVLTQKI